MESIISLVTANIVSGIRAASSLRKMLEATTPGAAFHTILNKGGTLRTPLIYSRQFDCGSSSFPTCAMLIDLEFLSSSRIRLKPLVWVLVLSLVASFTNRCTTSIVFLEHAQFQVILSVSYSH